jgi:VWFA-related protein
VGFGASPAALRGAVDRLRFSLMQPTTSVLDPISPWPPDAFDVFRERTTADDALRRIQDVVSLVQAQGGRKAVVLVSEGFAPFAPGWEFGGVRDGMRRLIDKANRAGVVIYALDPRGLVVTGLSAADAVSSAQSVAGLAAARGYALRETQDGLRYLSGETGGFAVIDSNDLARGLVRILDDQRGYYLIGYQPEDGTFEAGPERYRRIKVRLKRPGLKVRTRTGFYARPTE